jgi:hypothetical protein
MGPTPSILLVATLVLALTAPMWGAFFLLRQKSFTRFLMMRLAELGSIRPPLSPPAASAGSLKSTWLLLPTVLLVQTLLTIGVCLEDAARRAGWLIVAHDRWVIGAGFSIGALSYLNLVVGLVLHHRPNSSRTKKYTFLMLGIVGFWTLLLRLNPRLSCLVLPASTAELFKGERQDQASFVLALFLMGPLFYFVAGLIAVRTARRWDGGAGVPASRRLHKLYGGVMSLGLPVAIVCATVAMASIVIFWQLLAVYFLLRYALGERFIHEPILFLRSFRNTEGAHAFGRILSRTASRYGVVVGLVHATQRPSDLHRLARVTDHGQFHLVSDDQWQMWVLANLQRCSAVIIDVSVETGSVSWELENARRIAGPHKLLVLRQPGSDTAIPSGCHIVEYKGSGVGDTEIGLVSNWLTERFDGVQPGKLLTELGVWAILVMFVLCIVVGILADQREKSPQEKKWVPPPLQYTELLPIDMPKPPPLDDFLRAERELERAQKEFDQMKAQWEQQERWMKSTDGKPFSQPPATPTMPP